MTSYIRGFEDFIFSSRVKRRGDNNSEPKVNEAKDYIEIPKDPIIYKGYYLTIWPFRNEERHPDKSWGFMISEDPEGKEYISKTKGPVGNYEETLMKGQESIDMMPTNEAR